MDTFDIHLMDKNDGDRKEKWIIAIAAILLLLVVALVLAIRFIFKKESDVALPFVVPKFSANRCGSDATDAANSFGQR